MPYCQNCGTQVEGNFCPNCGAQVGTVNPPEPEFVIHENAKVKARYTTGQILLSGYFGAGFLFFAIGMLIGFFVTIFNSWADFPTGMAYLGIAAMCAFISFLGYLPAFFSIPKRCPKGMVASTVASFFVKTLLVIFAWGVTLAGCVYIIGIFFRVWRFGIWAATPNANQYTLFTEDGEKVPVVRYIDDLPFKGAERGKYVYRDENGEFHRPPLKKR